MSDEKHWIDNEGYRKIFWSTVKNEIGLTEDEVHEGLQVESVRDWKSTGAEAVARLREYKREMDEDLLRYEVLSVLGEGPEGLSEAPASLNTFGLSSDGWNVQVTLRDTSERRLLERFAKLAAGLVALGVKPCDRNGNYVIRQEMVERAAQATAPAGTPPPLPPAQSPTPPETTANGGNGNVILTEFVRVTAPKGKPVIEFWRLNRQFSEIRYHRGGENLLEMAPDLIKAGWTAEHFDTVGSEHQLPLTVHWAPSDRMDSRGNPYKDIVKVEVR